MNISLFYRVIRHGIKNVVRVAVLTNIKSRCKPKCSVLTVWCRYTDVRASGETM
jgi:hypothetical protein